MTKLRKQRRKQVYRHNVNRKRLRNKISNLGKIGCKELKEAWHFGRSTKKNLEEMGLSYDPNKTIKIPSAKDKIKYLRAEALFNKGWNVEEVKERIEPVKAHVAKKLEEEAKAPRVKLFRLPKGQVEWITYLMDKYGTDYKAMVRDKKNYNQETWKQLRAKINKFKSIPEQYGLYLKQRGLTENDVNNIDNYDSD